MAPQRSARGTVSAWHLTAQETDALHFKSSATENVQGKGGHSECHLSQTFVSVSTASRAVGSDQHIAVGAFSEPVAFPHPDFRGVGEFAQTTGEQNTVCIPKSLS